MGLLRLKAACHMDIKQLLLFAGMLFAGCGKKAETLPFYNTPDFTAEWIDKSDATYPKIHAIANFSLKNQLGKVINQDSLKGHVYLANFFFCSCPNICPKMMENLDAAQLAFKNNDAVRMISFSVMPWRDSVKILKKYGDDHQINPAKWFLLTGDKGLIYTLGRQSYFSEKRQGLDKTTADFLHTESLLLVDKQSRIRGIYTATDTAQVKRAIEDVGVLLNE